MLKLLGGLLIPCAWLGGFAFWAYSFIFWGVLQVVEGATAAPVDETAIVWGVIWLFLSKIVAGAIIGGGTFLGGILFALGGGSRRHVRIRRR